MTYRRESVTACALPVRVHPAWRAEWSRTNESSLSIEIRHPRTIKLLQRTSVVIAVLDADWGAFYLVLHGVIHLLETAVYARRITVDEFPFKTTLLLGRWPGRNT